MRSTFQACTSGDMPTEMTAISVYQVTAGKISKLMLLF
jgi:hypothetical protein